MELAKQSFSCVRKYFFMARFIFVIFCFGFKANARKAGELKYSSLFFFRLAKCYILVVLSGRIYKKVS